ncbi:MAG TPA: hypothetical protein VGL35_11400 [Rhizomicrobium sp.]|jgi:hypothetical protein
MKTLLRIEVAAALVAAGVGAAAPALGDACDSVMANGTYTVTLNNGAATATIDFTAASVRSPNKCTPGKLCPFGFHHNVNSLVVNGHSYGSFDLVSDCFVNHQNYADFALHPLTTTGHLGAIAAEWEFIPTGISTKYTVTDDFQATPGSGSSLTPNMSGSAAQ